MRSLCISLLIVVCLKLVNLQGTGSGKNGNLRLCIVEGRGSYKRGAKYCPILDDENSSVECVLGTDRLDCLRRIGKGTVDFGVFSPEDLVAAQWADIDVLVTHELRDRQRPFERSVVAVVNRRVLPETRSSLRGVLENTTLCHPGVGNDDLRPLSDTLSGYLESLVITRSCEPTLSLSENRLRALARFFNKACKAGPWVPDVARDAELKQRYPSLCAACSAPSACTRADRYWGNSGALNCLADGAGDVVWAVKDDVNAYFGLNGRAGVVSPEPFAYLCRDGSFQPLTNNSEPCIWLERPWPVVIAKRKASESVAAILSTLPESAIDTHWRGAVMKLLELRKPLTPVQPARAPLDHLASAMGFREAYSQSGCDPPRHITLCTKSQLEMNKCEWLSEAGAVYGVAPPLQCARRARAADCRRDVRARRCDVAFAGDHLVQWMRDYDLEPVLYEATPIVEKMNTVVAYVKKDSSITKMADLRGKRAIFPRFDGISWHSVMNYLKSKEEGCGNTLTYFGEICAPGIEKMNVSKSIIDKYTSSCYKNGEDVLDGEVLALKSLVEGKSDVAFLSMSTYNNYTARQIGEEWANDPIDIVPVCPEENMKYCFISWANLGHIFAAKNLTHMRRQEIINVFTKLDQLFGKQQPFHSAMFSMYGSFHHQLDVLFHNNTKSLATIDMLKEHPYASIPLNFERNVVNGTFDSCQLSDVLKGTAVTAAPVLMSFVVSLVVYLISS